MSGSAQAHFTLCPQVQGRPGLLRADIDPDAARRIYARRFAKEYERTSTTVVNAYVKPLVRHYLGNLDAGLARTGYAAPLRVMLSNGGLGSTETAADFPLRLINPDNFAGGSMRLDEGAARDGIDERIARPRGQSVLEAAWTVHDVVNETMGAAVRMHVTERGGNPRQATLVAFGGAGPLHACHLAVKLRVGRVMVPLRAGVLSALGLLVAPPAYDIVRTHKVPLDELDAASTGALIDEMADSIASLLGRLDTEGELRFARGVDVGYIDQSYKEP